MNKVYIVGGVRTPIGKTGGALRLFLPEELAACVLNEILSRFGLAPGHVDHVVLGNAAGTGGNLARVAVLQAGWPYGVPAMTVDAQCASGLAGVSAAWALVAAGAAELVVAGGMESTSMAPARRFHINDPRFTGHDDFYEQAPFSPLAIGDPDTVAAAETLAGEMDISRREMDALALESHRKACAAKRGGILDDIILPLARGGLIKDDECPRENMNMRLLSRLKGIVAREGRITAGNACLKHDGAAAVLLASPEALRRHALKPAAELRRAASAGCDPNYFPLGPVCAINSLLRCCSLGLEEIDAVEINEAFAVKILACCRKLGLPPEKVNKLGGALAYGHPYGASGAIILLHLLKTLEKTKGRFGIAAIGAVGGLGAAVLAEKI
ncbi:MAG: thiolase family protein [Acidaminococcales bacterium]|jgi:acetyl-CoA C-acetyltransferase|nr:thiolase family protein [Acidaminococcales bacterium]